MARATRWLGRAELGESPTTARVRASRRMRRISSVEGLANIFSASRRGARGGSPPRRSVAPGHPRGTGLEALVHPVVLLRHGQDDLLDLGVHARHIGLHVLRGKVGPGLPQL